MFNHARSYVPKGTSGLIFILGICEISCKCVDNAKPAPAPKPKPVEIADPETTLNNQHMPLHPHRLTPPPLPSGSVDSYDSDQHRYNLTSSGEERNKYGVNPYGVQRSGEFKLGIQHWADDEVMLMFPQYPPLRSFEKHYGRYGGLNARKFWAHWDISADRSANGFHSGFNSDNVMGGRPPPLNSHDFEYRPNIYPKRYYMRSKENPKGKKRVERAIQNAKNWVGKEGFEYNMEMVNPYDMGGRPPPGKTERRKRKTQEMANTFAIRFKRGVTPQMNADIKEKIQRVKRELDSDGHEETLNKLKKRNKKDTRGNKRNLFRTWMSKLVPEHAAHIEKLHEKGIDKLMEQKVHGMKKTYGELFHEHHEKTQNENKEHEPRHIDVHNEHELEMHGEHKNDLHHEDHELHHFEMKDHKGHEAENQEKTGIHEGLEPHHFEMHDGHEPHHEEHEGHPEHLEIHAGEDTAHHSEKKKLDEEHKLKAHKKILEDMYLKDGKKKHDVKDKHELEDTEHEESPPAQTAAAPVQQAQQQQYQQQLYQQQQQQNQMYNQQNQQYNNYNNYGGGGGGMGGMGMNGMGGMGMGGMGMNGMGMGGMGMNGMGGMGMNGMGGMGMNGMGMGQMGGFGAILNAVNNNLPKLSQTAQAQQGQGGNYPQNTQQNYGGQSPNYGGQNYPQSPAANGPDPNIQAAQDAAAAQQKAAQDQEVQMQQPDPQDSTGIQDNKDQDTSQDSSINAKAGDGSDDDIKADNSNGNDDLNMPSEDTINCQQDNAPADEQAPQFDNVQQNQQFDNAQLGQFGHYDTGVNSANMAAAAAG